MARNSADRLLRQFLLKAIGPIRRLGIPIPAKISKHLQFRGVVDVSVGSGASFKMQSHGHAIENRMYWYGKRGHEPETFLPWLEASKTAEVVLDIGANTGLYSLGAAATNRTSRVLAFEPVPRVAELTRHNARLNPSSNIEVFELAVSDENGTAILHDPGGDQPASASLRGDFLDCKQTEIKVRCVRIDDFLSEVNLSRVDLIKLDVEGIEELALRGMRTTLQTHMPTLFIEVLDARPELMAELNGLLNMGYQVGDLCSDGVVPYDLSDKKGVERNLLFAKDLSRFQ